MALRCSLFGHAFGGADVERARTERGERVVATVREVRTCDRCGATEVVGERTEVTAAGSVGAGEGEATDSSARDRRDVRGAGVPEAATDPETDDGVILEGGPDAGDDGGRARGEWPRRDHGGGDEGSPRPWPDPPESSDGVPDLQRGGWPEPDDDLDAELGGGDDADGESDDGLASRPAGDLPADADIVESVPDARGADRGEIPPDRRTEFVCPECGFAEPSAVASVRPGDVCPDCRSDYLEERPAGG